MPAISECPGTQVRKINQRGAPVIPVKAGIQMFFDFSGFWVGLAIARLPGMTPKLFQRISGTLQVFLHNSGITSFAMRLSERRRSGPIIPI